MENYDWDKKDLIFRKNKIELLLKNSNLEETKRSLLEYNDSTLNEMLWSLKNHKFNLNELIVLTKPMNSKINLFYDQINTFSTNYQNQIILDSHSKFNNKDYKYNDDILKAKLTFEEQKELLYKLYSFSDNAKLMLDKMFKPENHNLNFNTSNQFCFYQIGKKNYINIHFSDKIETYLCFAHELGHNYEAIIDKKNIPILNDKYVNYFEMFSLFFEHLSVDNLLKEKVINEDDRKDIMNYLKYTNIQDIEFYIFLLIAMGDKLSLSERLYIKGIRKVPINISEYYYSYIIAINMYYKYLNDPEYTLYLMEYICNNFEEAKEADILEYCDIDLSHDIITKHLDNIKTKNN